MKPASGRGLWKNPALFLLLGVLPVCLALGTACGAQEAGAQAPQTAPDATPEVTPEAKPAADAGQPKDADLSVPRQEDSGTSQAGGETPVNIETGQSLLSTFSPLHWGRLSLLSFNTLYVYDSNFFLQANAPFATQETTLQGLLVYTVKVRRLTLDLQYRPQLQLAGGNKQFDFENQMFDFHTFVHLTPRWTVNFSDQFQSVPNSGNLDQVGFIPNSANGSSTQNPLLAGAHSYLTNGFSVSAERKLTGRDRLSLLFRQEFVRVSQLDAKAAAGQPPSTGLTEQLNLHAEIGWIHTLGRDNEFGVRYAYDHESFPGLQGSTQLHGLLFSYSKRLGHSMMLRLGGGPALVLSDAAGGGAIPLANAGTSYQASASLLKTFRRSSLMFSYGRSNSFTGQITNTFNDRLDASYSRQFIRRINLTVGGSYVRQDLFVGQITAGKSSWVQADYRLARVWSLYTTYSYVAATGGPQPFGSRNLVTSGIRWAWASEAR